MTATPVACTACSILLPGRFYNISEMRPCPRCDALLRVEVFPAIFQAIEPGKTGAVLLVDDDAACYYHPEKKAAIPCEMCGRFLCALCDIEFNGRHCCASCIESGGKKKETAEGAMGNKRTLYGSLALGLAVYPILLWPFTLFTAPATLYIALRYWNAPRGIMHGSHIKSILAILFASVQIGLWVLLFVYLLPEM